MTPAYLPDWTWPYRKCCSRPQHFTFWNYKRFQTY